MSPQLHTCTVDSRSRTSKRKGMCTFLLPVLCPKNPRERRLKAPSAAGSKALSSARLWRSHVECQEAPETVCVTTVVPHPRSEGSLRIWTLG